jgi:hypothetical protein
MYALLLSTNLFQSNVGGMLLIVWNSLIYYGLPYVAPHYNMQIRDRLGENGVCTAVSMQVPDHMHAAAIAIMA